MQPTQLVIANVQPTQLAANATEPPAYVVESKVDNLTKVVHRALIFTVLGNKTDAAQTT